MTPLVTPDIRIFVGWNRTEHDPWTYHFYTRGGRSTRMLCGDRILRSVNGFGRRRGCWDTNTYCAVCQQLLREVSEDRSDTFLGPAR